MGALAGKAVVRWAVCLIILWAKGSATGDLFEEDGVLVVNQGEARTVAMVWRLAVLITPPTPPPFAAWHDTLITALQRFKMKDPSWAGEIDAWEVRTEALMRAAPAWGAGPEMEIQRQGDRQKRSPFDFVGNAFSWLTGTATMGQLKVVREAVRRQDLQTTAVIHNQRELMSMVNGTRNLLHHLGDRLRTVQIGLKKVWDLSVAAQRGVREAHGARHIDLALGMAERYRLAYNAQVARYRRQQMLLERGELSEDLVGRRVLLKVLQAMKVAGLEPLRAEWYYRFARAEIMMAGQERVAYSVSLPAVREDRYLVYGLRYLPIWVDKMHIRTIQGRDKVAVSTATTGSFYPTECTGHSPIVCWPGLESAGSTCEASLAVGGVPKGCEVRLSRSVGPPVSVVPPGPGSKMAAIAPHRQVVSLFLRCLGKPQEEVKANKPVLVEIGEGCTMAGEGWSLAGVGGTEITLKDAPSAPIRTLPAINISWPTGVRADMEDQLMAIPEIKIPLLSFKDMVEVPQGIASWGWGEYRWGLGGGAALLVLLVLGWRCRSRMRRCCRRRGDCCAGRRRKQGAGEEWRVGARVKAGPGWSLGEEEKWVGAQEKTEPGRSLGEEDRWVDAQTEADPGWCLGGGEGQARPGRSPGEEIELVRRALPIRETPRGVLARQVPPLTAPLVKK